MNDGTLAPTRIRRSSPIIRRRPDCVKVYILSITFMLSYSLIFSILQRHVPQNSISIGVGVGVGVGAPVTWERPRSESVSYDYPSPFNTEPFVVETLRILVLLGCPVKLPAVWSHLPIDGYLRYLPAYLHGSEYRTPTWSLQICEHFLRASQSAVRGGKWWIDYRNTGVVVQPASTGIDHFKSTYLEKVPWRRTSFS